MYESTSYRGSFYPGVIFLGYQTTIDRGSVYSGITPLVYWPSFFCQGSRAVEICCWANKAALFFHRASRVVEISHQASRAVYLFQETIQFTSNSEKKSRAPCCMSIFIDCCIILAWNKESTPESILCAITINMRMKHSRISKISLSVHPSII